MAFWVSIRYILMSEPRGILRNKEECRRLSLTGEGDLDRSEVIRNTRLNAQLNSESFKGERIRAKIAEAKAHNGDNKDQDHLKWDEINLYKTEQEKAATMKIDEPKTPYEGGFNPEGEYYQNDDEDDPIPEFSLGEGQFDKETAPAEDDRIVKDEEAVADDDEEEEEEEESLTAEERHKRFEEMRKAHYHLAANPLKHKIDISDDDDDLEDKAEPEKP